MAWYEMPTFEILRDSQEQSILNGLHDVVRVAADARRVLAQSQQLEHYVPSAPGERCSKTLDTRGGVVPQILFICSFVTHGTDASHITAYKYNSYTLRHTVFRSTSPS